METIIAAIIGSASTLFIAYLHKKRIDKKQDAFVKELKTRLSIKDSNILIISTKEDLPKRLFKSLSVEGESTRKFEKIIYVKK